MSMNSHKERVKNACFYAAGEYFNVSAVTSLTGLQHQRAYELLREMVADGTLMQDGAQYKPNNLRQQWLRKKWI